VYLDASAIVKLVVLEPESAALFAWLGARPARVSSAIARVEVSRAVRRAFPSETATARRAGELLDRLALVPIDRHILETAGQLGPSELRSLDAIHLATALSLGDDLSGLVTYDARLAAAATRSGFEVWAPA
jgi:predicted nucleic acid-binding protein